MVADINTIKNIFFIKWFLEIDYSPFQWLNNWVRNDSDDKNDK